LVVDPAANISFRQLVDFAKLRWRIERDYQELKQEVGLGHYEGRGWRGFHHHATMCIAAYGFLISERETIPPSGPRSTTVFRRFLPDVIDPGILPCGLKRHIPNSIATMRARLINAIIRTLPRCPCCGASVRIQATKNYDAVRLAPFHSGFALFDARQLLFQPPVFLHKRFSSAVEQKHIKRSLMGLRARKRGAGPFPSLFIASGPFETNVGYRADLCAQDCIVSP